jgi:nucleoside 2-deoxyribosyltransferase
VSAVSTGGMRWYIAAPLTLRAEAANLAVVLREQGNAIVSTWHDDPLSTVEYERACTDLRKVEIALEIREQIRSCDVMLVLVGPRSDRCGHCWEAGYGEGLGKDVRVFYSDLHAELPTILMLPLVESAA